MLINYVIYFLMLMYLYFFFCCVLFLQKIDEENEVNLLVVFIEILDSFFVDEDGLFLFDALIDGDVIIENEVSFFFMFDGIFSFQEVEESFLVRIFFIV